LGEHHFLWADRDQAFIMFGRSGRSCIALGDPVGPSHLVPALIGNFIVRCRALRLRPAFHEISESLLPVTRGHGLHDIKIAEEAQLTLSGPLLAGSDKRTLRNAVRRASPSL
jgi:phosphatidylglycerol lysyltransferase